MMDSAKYKSVTQGRIDMLQQHMVHYHTCVVDVW